MENILIHEFSHTIHNYGLKAVDPTFDDRLKQVFEKSLQEGRWAKTYAATNREEYWAEGVQDYFDCNSTRANAGVHNDVNTRDELKAYDPELFALIDEVFRQNPWRYIRYDVSQKTPAAIQKSISRQSNRRRRVPNRNFFGPVLDGSLDSGQDKGDVSLCTIIRLCRRETRPWPHNLLTALQSSCFVACYFAVAIANTNLVLGSKAFSAEQHASPQRRWWEQPEKGVYKARLQPHWLTDTAKFWYRNDLADDAREFILVDAGKTHKNPRSTMRSWPNRSRKPPKRNSPPRSCPSTASSLPTTNKRSNSRFDDARWTCDLETYDCTKWPAKASDDAAREPRFGRFRGRGRRGASDEENDEDSSPGDTAKSPDEKWTASVRDHNVFVEGDDGETIQLSHDGDEGNGYGMLRWSPDSKTLVAFRIEPGESKEVYLSSRRRRAAAGPSCGSGPTHLPGDKFTAYELNLFDVADKKQIKPKVDKIDFRLAAHCTGAATAGTSPIKRSTAATSGSA